MAQSFGFAPPSPTHLRQGYGAPGLQLPDDGERWVADTLRGMSLDEKIGQLLTIGVQSGFTPTDSAAFERGARAVREFHAGGLIVFGVNDAGGAQLGQPLAAASTLNRLQAIARTPLLVAADFEYGVGMRMSGATAFPRAMAFAASDDTRLLAEAARITAREARAIGIHVNLAPVSDVNSNPRNPVINTRSFGEAPEAVSRMVSAYVRALQGEGMLATLKHFPGHGDTDVDSHLGLPLLAHGRDRLDRTELPPFRAGIAAGVAAVMTSHIALPALDAPAAVGRTVPGPAGDAAPIPATFSPALVTGLLREALGFDGLVMTDSMSMAALGKVAIPRDAVVRALVAGHDLLLDVPDVEDAFFAVGGAIERGDISLDRIDESVERVLRAKARLGLHRQRTVSLEAIADRVGSRTAAASAAAVAERAVTLVRDAGNAVPLRVTSDEPLLYLAVRDYDGGWGPLAPGRALGGGLRARWTQVTTIELSDRSTAAEVDAARAAVSRHRAIVAGVFVRTMSGSGRMDLPSPLAGVLNDVGRIATQTGTPMVAVIFGNPYAGTVLPDVPAIALTYDWTPLAEQSALAGLAGIAPITGRLPITLSSDWPRGYGLTR